MSVHDHSRISREIEKTSGRSGDYRRRAYLHIVTQHISDQAGVTDRAVMEALGVKDANLVRPEITRMKNEGLLRETTKTACPVTGRQVRRVSPTGKPYTDYRSDDQGRRPKPHAVFHTIRTPTAPGDYAQTCHYEILPSRSKARSRYRELLEDEPNLYCAGYGPVEEATEPQWKEGL